MKSDDCESSSIPSKALSAPSLDFNQRGDSSVFLLFRCFLSVTLGET
jgi:hypothetical protein